MKKIIHLSSTFVLLLVIACKNPSVPEPATTAVVTQLKDSSGSKGANSNPVGENEDHKVITRQFTKTAQEVDLQIAQMITVYLLIKDDLVGTDPKKAAVHAASFAEKTGGFDKSYLALSQKSVYDNHFDQIRRQMHTLSELKDVNKQREVFSSLTRNVYELARAFGYKDKLFAVECPMAMNGKGAVWISTEMEIRNPYYGEAMLSCGKVIEEID